MNAESHLVITLQTLGQGICKIIKFRCFLQPVLGTKGDFLNERLGDELSNTLKTKIS